jgi:general secretion pathway protein L
VEEKLASDVEQCHFALGGRQANGEVSVAVIDRDLFAGWLESLRQANIDPDLVLVDVLQVPLDGTANLLVDGDRLLIRTGDTAGLSFSRDQIAQAIGLLSAAQRENLVLRVATDEREAINLAVSQVNAEYSIACKVIELDTDSFEDLCRGVDRQGLNLLQGEFQVKRATADRKGIWRSVVGLAALAFVLHLCSVLAQGFYLDRQAQEYERAAKGLYAEVFPNDRNVNDIRRRWRAKLGESGSSANGTFISLFSEAAKNLLGSELVLDNVNYNETRGDLIFQVQAPQSEKLVAFVQKLVNAGLKAEIGTISQEEDVVKGSIKIRSGGGV